jgi:hypothetical protein
MSSSTSTDANFVNIAYCQNMGNKTTKPKMSSFQPYLYLAVASYFFHDFLTVIQSKLPVMNECPERGGRSSGA